MANAVVGTLRVLLTMNTAEFEAGAARVSGIAGRWGKDFKKIGEQASALGSSLTKTLTLPMVAVGAGAAKLAVDFESAFAGVRKTVDATEPEFQAMSQAFRNLAKEIPISVNELARLGETAGALGIPKEEIVDFSRVMAMLGVTTNVTSEQAAESIAQIQTVFQSAGKETENFASALVHLGNNGASTEAQILELASRLGSAGAAAGMSQANVLGFAAAMANVGINAEAGGSALSQVFNKITRAVATGGESLENFAQVAGMSAEQFKQAFETDAAGAVNALVQGLGKIDEAGGNLTLTLDALDITEIRQSDTMRRLALNTQNVTDALANADKGWRENNALVNEANERFKKTESRLILLWNTLKDVGITFGDALLPAINGAIDALGALYPLLDTVSKAFAAMPGWVQGVAIAFGLAVAAAGPLLWVTGQLITSAGLVAAAFGPAGIATKALLAFGGILKTVTGAATITGAALTTMATGGLLAGLAYAVYEVAKAFKNLYDTWKAGGSMWAFFSARDEDNWVRRFLGLSDGAKEAAASMAPLATETQGAATAVEQVGAAASGASRMIKALGKEEKQATKDAKAFADAQDALFGRDLIATANGYAKALGSVSNVTKLSTTKKEELRVAVEAAIDAYTRLGMTAPKALEEILRATTPVLESTMDLSRAMEPLKKGVEDAGDSIYDLASGSLHELGLATNAADKEMRDFANRTGAVYAPTVRSALGEIGEEATSAGREIRENLSDVLHDLPAIISASFIDGDSFGRNIARVFANVGIEIAEAISRPIMARLSQMQQLAVNLGSSAAGAIGQTFGGSNAAMVGQYAGMIGGLALQTTGLVTGTLALGVATMGIGAAAVGVYLLARHYFSVSKEIKAARKELEGFQERLRATLTDQQRREAGNQGWAMDLIAVRDAYRLLGRSAAEAEAIVRQMWNTDDPDASRRAIQQIADAFNQLDDLREEAGTIFDELMAAADMAGGAVPESMRPMIDKLIELGLLTDEQAEKLQGLADRTGPSFDQMSDAAETFGTRVESMGKLFNQQRIDQTSRKYLNAMTTLIDGAADVGGVLFDAREEFSALAQDAIKHGATLPANLKPWIEELARSGLLLDENGDEIRDLSRIKWGEPMETQAEKTAKAFDLILQKIEQLIDRISTGLGGAISNLPHPDIRMPSGAPRSPEFPSAPPRTDDGGSPGERGVVPSFSSPGVRVPSLGVGGSLAAASSTSTVTNAPTTIIHNNIGVVQQQPGESAESLMSRIRQQFPRDVAGNVDGLFVNLTGALDLA